MGSSPLVSTIQKTRHLAGFLYGADSVGLEPIVLLRKTWEECRFCNANGGVQPPRHSVLFAAGEFDEPPRLDSGARTHMGRMPILRSKRRCSAAEALFLARFEETRRTRIPAPNKRERLCAPFCFIQAAGLVYHHASACINPPAA